MKSLTGSNGRLGLSAALAAFRRGVGEAERVTVGRGLRDRVGADHGAGIGAVLDHDLLAENFARFRRDDARDGVEPEPLRTARSA